MLRKKEEFKLKKLFLLTVIALFLVNIAFISVAWAEEDWQTITAHGITYSLPPDWQQLEEDLGFSEKESAWYSGDVSKPDQFLILARGENVATFLQMFIETETEDSEIVEDISKSIGDAEFRMVTMKSPQDDETIIFAAADKVFNNGDGIFMNITIFGSTSEEFQPILEKILDSFSFNVEE